MMCVAAGDSEQPREVARHHHRQVGGLDDGRQHQEVLGAQPQPDFDLQQPDAQRVEMAAQRDELPLVQVAQQRLAATPPCYGRLNRRRRLSAKPCST